MISKSCQARRWKAQRKTILTMQGKTKRITILASEIHLKLWSSSEYLHISHTHWRQLQRSNSLRPQAPSLASQPMSTSIHRNPSVAKSCLIGTIQPFSTQWYPILNQNRRPKSATISKTKARTRSARPTPSRHNSYSTIQTISNYMLPYLSNQTIFSSHLSKSSRIKVS